MAALVTLVGILITAAGVMIQVAPRRLIHSIASMEPAVRFGVAVVSRGVVGILFLAAASSCRMPTVVRVVGILSLVAAGGVLLLGRERLDGLVAWMASSREAVLRVKEQAREQGYHAVVNLRLETSRLASSRRNGKGTAGIEILAFGTALKLAGDP